MENNDNTKKLEYLQKIYYLLKTKDENDITYMNYIFSFLGFILIITGFFNTDPVGGYYYIFLLLLGKVIIFILIMHNLKELIPDVRRFLDLNGTKFFILFSISSYFLYSRAKVGVILNDIFGVSADSFTYTLYFGSIIYFVNHTLYYYLYILSIIELIIVLNLIDHVLNNKNNGWFFAFKNIRSYIFIVTSVVLVITYIMKNNDISEETIPYKLYVTAHKLDFDSKSRCEGVEPFQAVAYIGSNKDKIIISNSNYIINDESFHNFVRDKSKNYASFNQALKDNLVRFEVGICNLPSIEK